MAGKHGEGSAGRPNKGRDNRGVQEARGLWVYIVTGIQMATGIFVALLPRRGVPQQAPLRVVDEHDEPPRRRPLAPARVVVLRRHQVEFLHRFMNMVRLTVLALFLSLQDGRGRIMTVIALGIFLYLYRIGVIPPFPWFVQEVDLPAYFFPDVEPADRNEEENREHEE